MTASLLEPTAREWKEALQQIPHDMYHEPAYVELDAKLYGGAGWGNLGGVDAVPIPMHGQPRSLTLTLPPLATVIFREPGDG